MKKRRTKSRGAVISTEKQEQANSELVVSSPDVVSVIEKKRPELEKAVISIVDEQQSRSEEIAKSTNELKLSDLLNFTSAILVVLVTAILYFSGWIYVSAWYGFYGIELSQLQISTQVILIHGLPTTLTMACMIFLSATAARRFVANKRDPKDKGAGIAYIAIFLGFFDLVLLFAIFYLAEYAIAPQRIESGERAMRYAFASHLSLAFYLLVLVFFVSFMVKVSGRNNASTVSQQDSVEQREAHLRWYRETSQGWGLVVFLICFLTVISISWQIGSICAYYKVHLMTGILELPDVYLYSDGQISALAEDVHESKENNLTSFQYGPLKLIHSDQDAYYVSVFPAAARSPSGPRVYVVPRAGDILVSIQTKDRFTPILNSSVSERSSSSVTPYP